jgi:hypothetical protein
VKGEVEPRKDHGEVLESRHGYTGTGVSVVDGSRPGRGSASEDGRAVVTGRAEARTAEVRSLVVAQKPGNSGGAKGRRKAKGGGK